MPLAVPLAAALQPLRENPARAAILLDIDGTLAPIVARPQDARVPDATRHVLAVLAGTYGLVACVSGRGAATARELVGLEPVAYVGAHGAEQLTPGTTTVTVDPDVAAWAPRVQAFAARHTDGLLPFGVRAENKGTIVALHWRGADVEAAAERALASVAAAASDAGLATHWGRKVLELRPPVPLDKGRGIIRLLREITVDRAIYVGDDRTDIDAFAGLRTHAAAGQLDHTVCVGVRSDETPADLIDAADLMVDGPAGVVELLRALR